MDENESTDLYETRTNLLSSGNIIDYLWRRCDRNSTPFKPENSSEIVTKPVSSDFKLGKEILAEYDIAPKDLKNAMLKKGTQYRFEVSSFTCLSFMKNPVSDGVLALVYKPDRNLTDLFLIEPPQGAGEKSTLKLLLRSKQTVSLFGSYQTEMVTYY